MHLPPLCRCCGKPIKKRTRTIWFGCNNYRPGGFIVEMTERPRNKDEAARLTNMQIISVSWRRANANSGVQVVGEPDHDYISRAGVWDGESYIDDLFCTVECAANFGRMAAKLGKAETRAYHEALAKQRKAVA